jgi:hypothetical protein
MKKFILLSATLLLASPLLHAGFSERKLNTAIASATKSGKLIAFVFYAEYALPNCPTCVAETDAANKALKSAIPRSEVVVIEIEEDDKDLDKLPSTVSTNGTTPRIVFTDSQAEEVVTTVNGAPDREKAKEIKALIKEARAGA